MVKRLYVGNVSWSTSEDQLKEHFNRYGEVTKTKIVIDKETGKSRGFAFIDMENADDAIQQLNGTEFNGRQLKVSIAQEKNKK